MEISPLVRFTAQAISYLFHPLFIIAYMMLLLNMVNPYLFAGSVKDDFLLLFIRIVQFTIILPLAAIFLMRSLGFVESMQMQTAQERIGPYISTGILYIWTYLNMANSVSVPPIFRAFVLGASLSLAGAFFVNVFSKISLHTVGMGGWVAMMVITYVFYSYQDIDMLLLCVIVIAGGVGTARLLLEAHDGRDVLGGYVLGFVAQFLAFKIIVGI